jgi:rare lipoprotein A
MRRLLLVVLLASVGCGAGSERGGAAANGPAANSAPAGAQAGQASYYADSLAGNATASGEPYDPRALTGAHRDLPFGTVVDVIRRDDGRRVRIRINDRGPFTKGRIIDLSRAAAERIDMIRAGIVDVDVVVVSMP